MIGILDAVIKMTALSMSLLLRMKEVADAADSVFVEDVTLSVHTAYKAHAMDHTPLLTRLLCKLRTRK
jgi:hypothetical protein